MNHIFWSRISKLVNLVNDWDGLEAFPVGSIKGVLGGGLESGLGTHLRSDSSAPTHINCGYICLKVKNPSAHIQRMTDRYGMTTKILLNRDMKRTIF